ncbi:hypothetical protein BJ878DRAFT_498875 [Calycina marina]|uniref:Uncharacterized protein n=1 Tax=Calycina marina TaxID=1763456 RepID=A0A9P7Z6J1_9HELO|nr:hypothetical protein BJ878DRAFT_498875 [Calycina marina]
MALSLTGRSLLPFPPGANTTDTLILDAHYNLTTLMHWNYTYYSNRTLSNGTKCYLVFPPHIPVILENGTFLHADSCYSPINEIRLRGILGIVSAVLFGASLIFTFTNLRKHGRRFLPAEKQFRAVGRRWQWYWLIIAATCALVSGITGVDVDRYYLPELPIVLLNFFWFLMVMSVMAAVWEGVRHWGSWMEQQAVDSDVEWDSSRGQKERNRREKFELLIPLVFYAFFWMNFFMVIPRNWTNIEKQRDADQTRTYAEPVATDVRFKLGSFSLFGGWCTTVFSLGHSIHHYVLPLNHRVLGVMKTIPLKFLLVLPLALITIGYSAALSFSFPISPLNLYPQLGYVYGLGWAPVFLIVLILEVYGYIDPNEDRELIKQRRKRGEEIDHRFGIVKKPAWWRILHHRDFDVGVQERIRRNVGEIGGGSATTRKIRDDVEMRSVAPVDDEDLERKPLERDSDSIRMAAGLLFPETKKAGDGASERVLIDSFRIGIVGTEQTSSISPSVVEQRQKVRSMLDV